MKKLNEGIILGMGFKKFNDVAYSLTIDSEGLIDVDNNHSDEEFTLVCKGKNSYVLDGELEIKTGAELVELIAKVMYNSGVRTGFSVSERKKLEKRKKK